MSLEDLNKKIEKEHQEYLASLSPAERAKYLKEEQDFEGAVNQFWNEKYPKMRLEEKKKYWLAGTHKGMRTQGEAFGDEYSEFSKKWYDFAKKHEIGRAHV